MNVGRDGPSTAAVPGASYADSRPATAGCLARARGTPRRPVSRSGVARQSTAARRRSRPAEFARRTHPCPPRRLRCQRWAPPPVPPPALSRHRRLRPREQDAPPRRCRCRCRCRWLPACHGRPRRPHTSPRRSRHAPGPYPVRPRARTSPGRPPRTPPARVVFCLDGFQAPFPPALANTLLESCFLDGFQAPFPLTFG